MTHGRRTRELVALLISVALVSSGCSRTMPSADPTPASTFEERIETMREAYGVGGLAVVVVRGQTTVLSIGLGSRTDGSPYTARTASGAYSATKALSSFVYASLVEKGLFDLDATLGSFRSDLPGDWTAIPFWRLLNHTSGITMIVNRPEFERIYGDPNAGNADVVEVVRRHPLDYAPGEASRYRQSGYAVAEMIVADRLGRTWPELVAEHLTGPAGASATVHSELASGARTTPLLTSAGGYETTADDMAAIFKAVNAGSVVTPEFLEELLYRAKYNFYGYSLGSTLEVIAGVRTIGHSGGGGRANLRYVPRRRVGVAVFTDDVENNDLAIHVADMLVREIAVGEQAKLPIAAPLFSMRAATADEIVAFYESESDRADSVYDFARAEWALNRLGYILLREGRTNEAVAVFSLNTREHPLSANVHDSLGEAYFEKGDLEAALSSYFRALELDPSNRNAHAMIGRIRATIEAGP